MKIAFFSLFFPFVLFSVSPAAAQPQEGTIAIGGDIGLVLPTPSTLDGSTTIGGLVEYYITPRIGVRATAQWFELDLNNESFEMSNRRVGLHGTYNWEYDVWHPFAGAGISINSLEVESDDDSADDDRDIAESTKPGLDLFGGVEYFFRARTTLKVELGYQRIADFNLFDGPSNISLFVGVKHYLER